MWLVTPLRPKTHGQSSRVSYPFHSCRCPCTPHNTHANTPAALVYWIDPCTAFQQTAHNTCPQHPPKTPRDDFGHFPTTLAALAMLEQDQQTDPKIPCANVSASSLAHLATLPYGGQQSASLTNSNTSAKWRSTCCSTPSPPSKRPSPNIQKVHMSMFAHQLLLQLQSLTKPPNRSNPYASCTMLQKSTHSLVPCGPPWYPSLVPGAN